MPFRLPFNFPYFPGFNSRYTYPVKNNFTEINKNTKINPYFNPDTKKSEDSSKNNSTSYSCESSEYFFEVFGLKLYFDDILIICILFFLYTEGVQDQELFICLILLLLS